MSIGKLRKRAYFSRAKRTDDGGGGATVTWVPAFTAWCEIKPQTGMEKVAAGRLESSSLATLRLRSSAATRQIDPSYKVTIDGDDWQIRSTGNPDSKNRFLEMLLEFGVAQ